MKFRLQSLLRYRTHQRDLCRMYLAEVLLAQRKLQQLREELEQERELQWQEGADLSRGGRVSIERLKARRYHVGHLQMQLKQNSLEQQLVAEQLELCRQALIQADQKVRALEKLREKQQAEWQAEQIKRETRQVEEAWQALNFITRQQ